jgi:hypothetical protein
MQTYESCKVGVEGKLNSQRVEIEGNLEGNHIVWSREIVCAEPQWEEHSQP